MATSTDEPTPAQDDADTPAVRADQAAITAMEPRLLAALEMRRAGDDAKAEAALREIVRAEPRLPEPRLELAWLAASREDWVEAEAQAKLAVDLLRAGGQWTADVPAGAMLSFALNLFGETKVRPLEEGDLFLVDKPAFTAAWNAAAALFAEACRLDPANDDARRNRARYRPLPP